MISAYRLCIEANGKILSIFTFLVDCQGTTFAGCLRRDRKGDRIGFWLLLTGLSAIPAGARRELMAAGVLLSLPGTGVIVPSGVHVISLILRLCRGLGAIFNRWGK